jgi:hypothetical protein
MTQRITFEPFENNPETKGFFKKLSEKWKNQPKQHLFFIAINVTMLIVEEFSLLYYAYKKPDFLWFLLVLLLFSAGVVLLYNSIELYQGFKKIGEKIKNIQKLIDELHEKW